MQGLFAVFDKELRDHFSSYRFVILFALIAMISLITSYMAGIHLREDLQALADNRFPFLMLFSTPGALFSMVQFVAFLGPLMGLVLGFDSINRERADGTLIKIISQPIYRDAVINGKFLAAVVTISIMLLSIFLVTTGFGLAVVGLVPEMEEVWRLFIFLVISIFYVSFWIALSIFFSILFKSIVTSALASGALWIFLWLIIPVGANVVADAVAPIDIQDETRTEIVVRNYRVKETISLASPMVLYSEATAAIVDPMLKTTRSITLMGPMERLLSARFQNPLALGQSVVVVLPHLTALIAITLICFALSYVVFMLQEIRT